MTAQLAVTGLKFVVDENGDGAVAIVESAEAVRRTGHGIGVDVVACRKERRARPLLCGGDDVRRARDRGCCAYRGHRQAGRSGVGCGPIGVEDLGVRGGCDAFCVSLIGCEVMEQRRGYSMGNHRGGAI